MYFECHVTVEIQKNFARLDKLASEMGWKTSTIEGDPALGKRPFFYFTRHGKRFSSIHDDMRALCKVLGDEVVRVKIEQILLDTKSGVDLSGEFV